jgi:hypothetical protein
MLNRTAPPMSPGAGCIQSMDSTFHGWIDRNRFAARSTHPHPLSTHTFIQAPTMAARVQAAPAPDGQAEPPTAPATSVTASASTAGAVPVSSSAGSRLFPTVVQQPQQPPHGRGGVGDSSHPRAAAAERGPPYHAHYNANTNDEEGGGGSPHGHHHRPPCSPRCLLTPLRRGLRLLLALLLACLALLARLSRRVLQCRVRVTLRFRDLPTLALVYVLLAEVIRLGTPKRFGACVEFFFGGMGGSWRVR